jgi:hypothetical protein
MIFDRRMTAICGIGWTSWTADRAQITLICAVACLPELDLAGVHIGGSVSVLPDLSRHSA